LMEVQYELKELYRFAPARVSRGRNSNQNVIIVV
jgi:hypothetical protein